MQEPAPKLTRDQVVWKAFPGDAKAKVQEAYRLCMGERQPSSFAAAAVLAHVDEMLSELTVLPCLPWPIRGAIEAVRTQAAFTQGQATIIGAGVAVVPPCSAYCPPPAGAPRTTRRA